MSQTRRLGFWCVLIVAVAAVIDVLALITGIVLYGPSFYRRAAVDRARIAAEAVGVPDTEEQLPSRLASFRVHPFLGFVADPNLRLPEYSDPIEPTPLGFFRFRDPEPTDGRQPLRVGIFGGSVAQQFAGMGRHRLIQALDSWAAARDRRIVIEPFALPGYKQPQQLITLAYLLTVGEHLDVVINIDGFNEIAVAIHENAWTGINPVFPRSWGQLAASAHDPAVLEDVGQLSFVRTVRRQLAHASLHPIVAWSATVAVVWRALDGWLVREIGRRQGRIDQHVTANSAARIGERSDPELIGELSEVWRRTSLAMHQLCAANGMTYLHILQPNQYVPGAKKMAAEELHTAFRADSPYRSLIEKGYPHLRAEGEKLRAAGVAFRDLSAVFANVEEPLFVDDCCHFNVRGNEILAEHIAEAIEDLPDVIHASGQLESGG